MVNKWFADFGPSQWIAGRTAKFPINEPIFDVEIIDETSVKVSDPVGKVLFFCCRSFEFIVAQPNIVNDENTNKLPAYEYRLRRLVFVVNDVNCANSESEFHITIVILQLMVAKSCLKTGGNCNIFVLDRFRFYFAVYGFLQI